ncbi:hypothetical protein ACFQE7_25180 [Nonomuraea ferruginea]|uniref:hypothetical protein n=1 Tax=Nonomuraea ferruginea TaxID=46174 RepID=UPI003622E553
MGLTGLLPDRRLPYTRELDRGTSSATGCGGGCGKWCAGAPAARGPSLLEGSGRRSPGERMARVRSSSATWLLLPLA